MKTKIKNRILVHLLMIFILLLISACGSQKNDEITNVDVRKGTDGLLMEFLKNAPPENVFEDSGFPVSIKLQNVGASDIKGDEDTTQIEGGLLIFGFENASIKINPERIEIPIEGKTIFNPKGGEEFVNSEIGRASCR